ncbi:hypothetical protein V4D30_02025 [Thermodesulfovibrio sp. 3907-1M]|uniref:Probable replication restart protein PriA n=1 Tax=Thermodesulfovibrio autotrophicus TaxID=3118333 RepID=A0AAU8GXB2_9BACT
MPYFDVSIPFKLKTLTYQYDKDVDLKGFAVKVPLKNRTVEGIVIKGTDKPEEIMQIKRIQAIIGRAYEEKFIDFLYWMSYYYVSEIGSVLRATFFEEIMRLLKGIKNKKVSRHHTELTSFHLEHYFLNDETLSKIVYSTNMGNYKAFLVHCPDFFYEMKLMVETVKKLLSVDGAILLMLPEKKDAQRLYSTLKELDCRVVLLHSEMSRSEILFSIKEIIENRAKIIVGTRFAIFAPVKKLSLIMVSQESHWLYKEEQSPRYHARDCAIMRGFIEGCPVVLTDFMPSTTSYYNALRGKYEFIEDFNRVKHPQIKVLRQPYQSIFHPETLLYMKLNYKEGILVTCPRSGYSLLRCSECGEVIKCEKCGLSMTFHKSTKTVECFRCGFVMKAPQQCLYCSGVDIHPVGVGVERIKDELKNIFLGRQSEIKEMELETEEYHGVWVAETGKVKKGHLPVFKGVVVVDFDFFLFIPDYRTLERAFAKVLSLSQLIREDGDLFIQTRNPSNEFFKFIRSYNFKDFYLYELKHRQEAAFPPFSRLIKLIIKIKESASESVLNEIKDFLKSHVTGEIMGPTKNENGEFVFILRAKDKKRLIDDFNKAAQKLKFFKGISFKVEVDPVNLKI